MHVHGPADKVVRSARFVEKPWVADFATFVNRDASHRWIVGQSRQACTSQHEAEQQAIHSAAARLQPYVRDLLPQYKAWRRFSTGGSYTHEILGQIEREVRRGGTWLISDRFTQSFSRPYGVNVWREAILVDASADKVNRLAKLLVTRRRSERASWLQTALSVAGLGLVVCVVYLFLNLATRGYYVWALRAAAIIVVAAGIFFLVMWA